MRPCILVGWSALALAAFLTACQRPVATVMQPFDDPAGRWRGSHHRDRRLETDRRRGRERCVRHPGVRGAGLHHRAPAPCGACAIALLRAQRSARRAALPVRTSPGLRRPPHRRLARRTNIPRRLTTLISGHGTGVRPPRRREAIARPISPMAPSFSVRWRRGFSPEQTIATTVRSSSGSRPARNCSTCSTNFLHELPRPFCVQLAQQLDESVLTQHAALCVARFDDRVGVEEQNITWGKTHEHLVVFGNVNDPQREIGVNPVALGTCLVRQDRPGAAPRAVPDGSRVTSVRRRQAIGR